MRSALLSCSFFLPLICFACLSTPATSSPTVYNVNRSLSLPLSYPYRGIGLAFTAGLDSTNADLLYVSPDDSVGLPLIYLFNTSTPLGHLQSSFTFIDPAGQKKFGFERTPVNGKLTAMRGARLVMWDKNNAGVVVMSADTGVWQFAFKNASMFYCNSMAVDSDSNSLAFASDQLYLLSLTTGAVLSSSPVPYRAISGAYGLVFNEASKHFLVVLTAAVPPSRIAEFDRGLSFIRNVSLPGGELLYAITADELGWVVLFFGSSPVGYICSIGVTNETVATACNKQIELSYGQQQLTRRLDGSLIGLVLQNRAKENATLVVYTPSTAQHEPAIVRKDRGSTVTTAAAV